LDEEFLDELEGFGVRHARRWYWFQVLGTLTNRVDCLVRWGLLAWLGDLVLRMIGRH